MPDPEGGGRVELTRVLEEVARERSRQDEKWGGPEHDDEHWPMDWSDYITEHLNKADTVAMNEARRGNPIEYRRRMVEVAALAVAAVEAHDRRTLPEPTKEVGEGEVTVRLTRAEADTAMDQLERVGYCFIPPDKLRVGLSEGTDPEKQGRRVRASANPPSGPLAQSDSTSSERCPTCGRPRGAKLTPFRVMPGAPEPKQSVCPDPFHTDPPQEEER